MVKHATGNSHKMDWEGAMCLERETRTVSRKIIEGCHIKANEGKCMNLNEGLFVSAQYKGREGVWIWRERQENKVPDLSRSLKDT